MTPGEQRYADIKAELVRRRLTLADVAKRTPWSEPYVRRALQGGRVPENVSAAAFAALKALLEAHPVNGDAA